MEKYVDEEKQELDNNTELNLGQIRSMLDEIESMTVEEHQNIIKILADNNVKSMENENGLFVKMNLETAIQSMEPVRDIINKNVQEDVDEITSNDVNIEVEDWKMEIIQKMRTESKVRSKKRKQTSKQNVANP